MGNIEEMKEELATWLSDPAELGKRPSKIEFVKTIQDTDKTECHIFKFKTELLDPWKLGIVSESGVFSEMQAFDEAKAEADALEILNMLKNYWKHMAATLKPIGNES